jgi:hypothetical protein
METLGVNSYRFSISWARILPSKNFMNSGCFQQERLTLIKHKADMEVLSIWIQKGDLEILIGLASATITSSSMLSCLKVSFLLIIFLLIYITYKLLKLAIKISASFSSFMLSICSSIFFQEFSHL